jgi:ABC-2 type transport system ATP-binding protein
MNESLLEVRELRKTYGAFTAVDGISFSVRRGECLGLLGPNGAGKTTTLSMLAGLLTPNGGQVLIEGRALAGDTDPIKRKLGLVPQELALYDELTARDNLNFFGALQNLDAPTRRVRIAEALEIVGLSDRAGDKTKTFSGGMKRRLNLAAALLHQPELLLLDEPTVGVDPQSRNAIFDNIEALRAQGKTILYTTHYMEEVERLCDRVVIIDHGKIIVDDTLANLRRQAGVANVLKLELAEAGATDWLPALRQLAGVRTAELAGVVLAVELDGFDAAVPAVLVLLRERGQRVIHLSSQRPTLESIFLAHTGRQLRDH